MKIKAEQAIFAILDLTMEMAAKQRAAHQVIVSMLAIDEADRNNAINQLYLQSNKELDLIRAKVLQYSETDPKDLLKGLFDV